MNAPAADALPRVVRVATEGPVLAEFETREAAEVPVLEREAPDSWGERSRRAWN